jgi:hypothetical protein
MSFLTADAELNNTPAALASLPSAPLDGDTEPMDDGGDLTTPKGILVAVLVSLPFWGLIALTVYLLV